MPTKAELYAQMAEKVATQLTGSWQEWAGFLTTAARLYKYPFHEPVSYTHLDVYKRQVLEDDGQYANFKLEFDQRKGGSR